MSPERVDSVEQLGHLPLFAGFSEPDLQRLARSARPLDVDAGTLVMREGTPGDGLYLVISGSLEVTKREGGQDVVLARRGPGDFLGEISLLEQGLRSASVRALEPTRMLVVDPDGFRALLESSPGAAMSVLRTVAGRLRSTEATLMQREKLASLGTLAAGLAHELNNPSAAIARATEHLRTAFADWQRATTVLGELRFTPEQSAALRDFERAVATCGSPAADALACSREEGRITDWLEDRGVDKAWEVAPPLVAYGWDVARVEALERAFPGDAFAPVLAWLAAGYGVQGLIEEIHASGRAISGIVKAVKTYTHLDQAPVQDVDVRASLEDTLVILKHKLKEGVTVRRDFAPDLPRVEAYASELNQVWTNLIDNAIDAMGGKGTIELRARASGEWVEVRIADDGPGIPDELRDRIFDPFFTTKPPGVGSGLGLHIVHNIVANQHNGRLEVESRPGRTAFTVTLPVRLKRAG